MLGVNRIAKKQLEIIDKENLEVYLRYQFILHIHYIRLEAYAAGVNHFVKNMKIFPFEFYLLWVEFEPWTAYDCLAIQALLQYFVSFDWFLELTRERLLEIYDIDIVEKMMPYKNDYMYFNNS